MSMSLGKVPGIRCHLFEMCSRFNRSRWQTTAVNVCPSTLYVQQSPHNRDKFVLLRFETSRARRMKAGGHPPARSKACKTIFAALTGLISPPKRWPTPREKTRRSTRFPEPWRHLERSDQRAFVAPKWDGTKEA